METLSKKIEATKENVEILKDDLLKYDLTFKYYLIGNSEDGKQDIIEKFANKKQKNTDEYNQAEGFEVQSINLKIKNKIVKLQLWDYGDIEIFKPLISYFCKMANCEIFVYDVTKRESFENIKNLIAECKENSSPETIFIIVGNRSDLEDERIVNYEEGKTLADKYSAKFYEVSSKNNKNIPDIFIDSALILFEKNNDINENKSFSLVAPKKEKIKKKFC